jgi:D-alanine transaminase
VPDHRRDRIGVCLPVDLIDGQGIANGHPGSVPHKIREVFFGVAEKIAI